MALSAACVVADNPAGSYVNTPTDGDAGATEARSTVVPDGTATPKDAYGTTFPAGSNNANDTLYVHAVGFNEESFVATRTTPAEPSRKRLPVASNGTHTAAGKYVADCPGARTTAGVGVNVTTPDKGTDAPLRFVVRNVPTTVPVKGATTWDTSEPLNAGSGHPGE